MNEAKIELFDIDGTITAEGCDLWFECTSQLITDKAEFEAAIAEWKKKKLEAPYEASQWMMDQAIKMLSQAKPGEAIYNLARKITQNYIRDGKIRSVAISEILAALRKGNIVVFSSTNYAEGAQAFYDVLFENQIIDAKYREFTKASGTVIDWMTREIAHFNMDHGKVEALGKLFGQSRVTLRQRTVRAFGDDPRGNDRGILELAQNSFVIATNKNRNLVLPNYFERVDW